MDPPARCLTPVKVVHHTIATELKALIDSGADEGLMSWGLVKNLTLETKVLDKPVQASALNGKELFLVTHITEPIELCIGEHQVLIYFHVFVCFIRNDSSSGFPMAAGT